MITSSTPPPDRQAAIALRAMGKTVREIAAVIDRPERTIHDWLRTPSPRRYEHQWKRADILHLCWYAERGFSLSECAAVMGRTTSAVKNMATQLKISFHGPAGAPFRNRNSSKYELRQRVKKIMAEEDEANAR